MKLTRHPTYRPPVWATERRPVLLAAIPNETPVQNQARVFAAQAAYLNNRTFTTEEHDDAPTTNQGNCRIQHALV